MDPVNRPKKEVIEPDIIDILRIIWNERKYILRYIFLFGFLGLIIALLSPAEYSVRTTLVQNSTRKNNLSNLLQMGSIPGLKLDMSDELELAPVLYPKIVNSVPFQIELLNTPLKFEKIGKTLTLHEYFKNYYNRSAGGQIKKYTIGLPGEIIKLLRNNKQISLQSDSGYIYVTREQKEYIDRMPRHLIFEVNEKQGVAVFTTRMPEPLPAAQLADRAIVLLQDYVTRFKIEKSRSTLEFVQQRFDEQKNVFETAQKNLASFRDKNRFMISALALTEQERLLSDYNLQMGIYTELAKQLEQAKIQVKQDTPVLSVIEPVVVPGEKSSPQRLIIIIVWMFIGTAIGMAVAFLKNFIPAARSSAQGINIQHD